MSKNSARGSWRPKGKFGKQARTAVMMQRLVATAILLGMFGAVTWLIVETFWPSQTHMVFLTGGYYDRLGGEPIEFPLEDMQALSGLEDALAGKGGDQSNLIVDVIPNQNSSASDMLDQFDGYTQEAGEGDSLLIFLTAHGVVQDGEAFLKCPLYLGNPDQLVPLPEILQRMKSSPAATKLLILDAGREEADPRSGVTTAAFSRYLERDVVTLADPNLWVLASNSGLERSYVSTALRKSIFGYVVAQGLLGAANAGDDEELGLFELFRFVRRNVSGWVSEITGGKATQTPLLLHHERKILSGDGPALLLLSKLPKPEPDVKKDVTKAQTQEPSQVLAMLDNIRTQFGIPTATNIANTLGNPLGFSFGGGSSGSSEEETPAEPEEGEPVGEQVQQIDYRGLIATRLAEAWKLAATVESRPTGPLALGAAPHFWRALTEELLWCDRLAYAGEMRDTDQEALANRLRSIIGQLQTLSDDDAPPPNPASANWSDRIRIANPTTAVEEQLDESTVRSLAMAERIAAAKGLKLPPELVAFTTIYDHIISGSDKPLPAAQPAVATSTDAAATASLAQPLSAPEQLAELHENLLANESWLRYYELQLFDRLQSVPNLDWSLKLLALETRRTGERVAADLVLGAGWARETVETADRLRWEAERLIESRADSNWDRRARSQLERAQTLYREAEQAGEAVRLAIHERNRVLGRVRDYLLWRRNSNGDEGAGAPRRRDLLELFRTIGSLDTVLGEPGSNVGQVADRLANMRTAQRAVERGVSEEAVERMMSGGFSSGDAWRMKILAGTLLLPASARQPLRERVKQASIDLANDFELFLPAATDTPLLAPQMTDATWNMAWNQLELERLAAALALCAPTEALDQPGDLGKFDPDLRDSLEQARFQSVLDVARASIDQLAVVQGFDQALAESTRDRARWYMIELANEALVNFHANLADRIVAKQEGATSSDRASRLADLRAAVRDMQMLDAREVIRSKDAGMNPLERLDRANWYDLLVWHGQRFYQAMEDAPADEQRWLLGSADACRRLAGRIRRQPPVPAFPAESNVRISVPSQINLTSSETKLKVDIGTGATATPVWLVFQYDANLLSIAPETTEDVYHEHQLQVALQAASVDEQAERTTSDRRRRSAALLDAYPYRPDLFGLKPTVSLPANGAASITFTVQRAAEARGQATLVVKAVGLDTYIRQPVEFQLPGREMYRLLVDQDPEVWKATGDGLRLYPWPNRTHTFPLQIANGTKVRRDITVALFSPERNARVTFPQGAQDSEAARNLIRPFGVLTPVAPEVKVELPASDDPVPLLFPPSEDAAAAAPAAGAEATEPTGQPLQHGLLVVMKDVATGKQTLRRIRFEVQRPIRYLRALATYSRAEELLEIRVTPLNRNAIPPGGLRISCDFQGEVGGAQIKEALLVAPSYQAVVQTRAPFDSQGRVKALISVNDYPRAFVFDVLCREIRRGVEPEKDLSEVRILAPRNGTAYQAPTDWVMVEMQVDAPSTSFNEGRGDFIDVGLDTNLNRQLDLGEPKERLISDRQVKLSLQAMTAGGMVIDTRVSDFKLPVPAVGLSDRKAGVLGHMVVGGVGDWYSNGVEIVLDGTGPVIRDFEIRPREIVLGTEFEVITWPDDVQLSGAAKVEIAFDRKGSTFEDNEPVAAETVAGIQWSAKLKAERLTIGSHDILARATDKVGNVGTPRPLSVTILAPPVEGEKETEKKKKEPEIVKNDVFGRMRYGTNPLEGPEVTLTDAQGKRRTLAASTQGRFVIRDLLPGPYTLEGRAKSRNGLRKVTTQINVSDKPNSDTTVQLELR